MFVRVGQIDDGPKGIVPIALVPYVSLCPFDVSGGFGTNTLDETMSAPSLRWEAPFTADKWELVPRTRRLPIGKHELPNQVVECGSQIVNNIPDAYPESESFGLRKRNLINHFALLILPGRKIATAIDTAFPKGIKVTEVVFGSVEFCVTAIQGCHDG